MDIFVARQPIFNSKQEIFAYELLFRDGSKDNTYRAKDGDQATAQVIVNSMWSMGIDTITNGKRAFINFTHNHLTEEVASILPPDQIVVEILETVEPTEEIITACNNMRSKGFLLALDDFVFEEKFEPFLDIADIIKVDFSLVPLAAQWDLFVRCADKNIKFLAEKVETQEQFTIALEMGYSYFQGYFFSKPIIVKRQGIPSSKLAGMRIMREINSGGMDLDKMEEIIQRDVSLSYKLLSLINSAAFGIKAKVNSIRHALVLLGTDKVAKWASLVVVSDLGTNKPHELVTLSVMRARAMEEIMLELGYYEKMPDAFMLGLFSLLDALLDRPLTELLDAMPLSDDVRAALLATDEGLFRQVYLLTLAYERGDWSEVERLSDVVRLPEEKLPGLIYDAVLWANSINSPGS